MLRQVFLALSRSQGLGEFVVRFPIAQRMSRRFVAGETLREAIEAIRSLNQRGILATIDHLQESITS